MRSLFRGVKTDASKDMSHGVFVSMPPPKTVTVPLKQHSGVPARAVVSAGDYVYKGSVIGEPQTGICAFIHSPVSGYVKEVTDANDISVIIENDGLYKTLFLNPLTNPSSEDIIERVRLSGIVGMGGAGFPTHIKLAGKGIDIVIINGAECEPYLTCDYTAAINFTDGLVLGAEYIKKAVNAENIIFAFEETAVKAASEVQNALKKMGHNYKVAVLPSFYPQGAERQLIYTLLKRIVPLKKLPSFVGAVVDNVQTALAVYKAVKKGEPLISRIVTLSGGGILNPGNYEAVIGTSVSDLISFSGGERQDKKTVKLLDGGPMTGIALNSDAKSVTKTTSGILLLTEEEALTENPSPCINCGRCYKACPMNLMPMYIDQYTLSADFVTAAKYGAMACIECGCCAYVCPAKRPLVQSVVRAKAVLKKRGY